MGVRERKERAFSGSHWTAIADDVDLVPRAALDGSDLAFLSEHEGASYLADGRLVRALQRWCQPFPGFFIYYPSRRQKTAALAALVE